MLRLENIHIFRLSPSWEVTRGALEIDGGRIRAVGPKLPPPGPRTEVVDLEGAWVLPGFIQSHVHLCQTIFRGLAENLPLERWLRERIWPLESALTADAIAASARLGAAELIAGGTTAVLDMGSVHHTERIGSVLKETGLAGLIGKAIMDTGDGVPEGLLEATDKAIQGAVELGKEWDGEANGTIRVTLAPRFVLSVSRRAWKRIREVHEGRGWRIHTHACETPWEIRASRQILGKTPIAFLEGKRLLDPGVTLAHGVWLGRREEEWLAASGSCIVHCPSSNMKLGSGLAEMSRLRARGIPLGLGCDGAACNNGLDMFEEMRRAILVSAVRSGPHALTARDALEMATSGGARALGWADETGALEPGRRADLLVLWPWGDPSQHTDPHETIVQAGGPHRVRRLYVAGRRLYSEGRFTTIDVERVLAEADDERRRLLDRLGWPPSDVPRLLRPEPEGTLAWGEPPGERGSRR